MIEAIKKENLQKNLETAELSVNKLKYKIETLDDLNNIIIEDLKKIEEKVKMMQFKILTLRERINKLPESTEEEKEIEELKDIDFLLFNFTNVAERHMMEYFNNSLEFQDVPIPIKKPSLETTKEIIRENETTKEKVLKFQEVEETILTPLLELKQPVKYLDENGNSKIRPISYYEKIFKKINFENLDLAIKNPKYIYDVIEKMSSYLKTADENYIKNKISREFGKILSGNKENLIPEKYETTYPNGTPNTDDQEIVIELTKQLISCKEYSSMNSQATKGIEEIITNNIDKGILELQFKNVWANNDRGSQILTSIIEKNINSKAYAVLENMINAAFSENNYEQIQTFVISTELAKIKLNDYLMKKFQVSFSEFKNVWNLNKRQKHYSDISNNLKSMDKIEEDHPGNVKKLIENYGIREFKRYPNEILIAQLKEEDVNQPYGIIVYPTKDENDAFDTHKEVYKNLFKDTRDHYGLKIYEISNKRDLARIFIKNNQKYASENKISFMILGGHGENESIAIGHDSKRDENNSEIQNTGNEINKDDLKGSGVKKVSKFFEKDPQIILVSCSTGAEGGIGQEISKEYDAKVIAPKKPTNLARIFTSYKNGKINFDVKYNDLKSTEYISGKKIK